MQSGHRWVALLGGHNGWAGLVALLGTGIPAGHCRVAQWWGHCWAQVGALHGWAHCWAEHAG
ncbi:unnamed protein product, partial [Staurois parvus]